MQHSGRENSVCPGILREIFSEDVACKLYLKGRPGVDRKREKREVITCIWYHLLGKSGYYKCVGIFLIGVLIISQK